MKKILTLLIAGAMLMGLSGCGSSSSSDDGSSSKTDSTASSSQADSSAADSSSESGSGSDKKITKQVSMSVKGTDGKMTISRPENKSTPMGDKGKWTIFVYLCGTDLESSGQGSATGDIQQMMEAESSDNVRFVVQTGGTKKWINEVFSASEAERWIVQNQDMKKVGSVPLKNMGSSENLADFLKWGVKEYASEKMGVIFWDHGGGCIQGACVDELNGGDTLDLMEINSAFADVYEGMTDKFEFIGFDCCLMGTAEVANILASYARYFYGSQETEPGTGWDYTTFTNALVKNPTANGAELGKVIADSFYNECASAQQEKECTLTIVDLSKMDDFVIAFNDFSKKLFESAGNDLKAVVKGVTSADNFGGNNKSEGYTNMVDVGGIISQCSKTVDGSAALEALKNCIVYNKNGANHSKASGLSVFYPLKVNEPKDLQTFSKVTVSPYYLSIVDMVAKGFSQNGYSNAALFDSDGNWDNETETEGDDYFNYASEEGGESKLITFAEKAKLSADGTFGFKLDESGKAYTADVSAVILMDLDDDNMVELGQTIDINADWEDTGVVTDQFDGSWLGLPDGQLLAMYVVSSGEGGVVYTSPIFLNGKRTNLRIVRTNESIVVEGAWDGIDEHGMAAREITKIKEGDKIVPAYFASATNSDKTSELKGKEYTWAKDSAITFNTMPAGDYYYGFCIEDIFGDTLTTDVQVFRIAADGKIQFITVE